MSASHLISEYMPQRTEDGKLEWCLHTHAYCSIIETPKRGSNQMSNDKWLKHMWRMHAHTYIMDSIQS